MKHLNGEIETSTPKQSSGKRKAAAGDVVDVEPEQVEATLARNKPQLEAQDFELITRLWSPLTLVMRLVRAQRASIARLRRLFGLASSEKTRGVTGAEPGASAAPSADDATHAEAADSRTTTEKSKPKGHGRLGVSDYPTPMHHAVLHAEHRRTLPTVRKLAPPNIVPVRSMSSSDAALSGAGRKNEAAFVTQIGGSSASNSCGR